MAHFAGRDIFRAQYQAVPQNFEGARAKLDVAIFLGLGAVFISPQDTCYRMAACEVFNDCFELP